MNIGEAAERAGLRAKTIRYYEDIGLIGPAERRANNYRDYSDTDLVTLRFLKRARSLGFSVEDCRHLLDLYRDKKRASADVKAVAQQRIGDIDRKIGELRGMRRALVHLMQQCHGDERPDCPIIDDLAGEPS